MESRDSTGPQPRPDTDPEPTAQPVTFGDLGVALVNEVCTPQLVHRQLSSALKALSRGDGLADYGTQVVSTKIRTPLLIAHDGHERGFAVTIRAELESRFGPELLALGFDSAIEIDLTLWLRTFSPAIVQLDVDPVRPDDLRVRTRARSEWLPVPLFGAATVATRAKRSLSVLSLACNQVIERSAELRRVDVLEYLRRDLLGSGGEQPHVADQAATTQIGAETDARQWDTDEHGERISFARFGEELINRGLDGQTVAAVLNSFLAHGTRFELDAPFSMWVSLDGRVGDVTPIPVEEPELRFRLSLGLELEVQHRPDATDRGFVAHLQADLTIRIRPLINPSALLVSFDEVSASDVRFATASWMFRGRSLPIPVSTMSWLLRRRLARELNQRLAEAGRPIVLNELRYELPG